MNCKRKNYNKLIKSIIVKIIEYDCLTHDDQLNSKSIFIDKIIKISGILIARNWHTKISDNCNLKFENLTKFEH